MATYDLCCTFFTLPRTGISSQSFPPPAYSISLRIMKFGSPEALQPSKRSVQLPASSIFRIGSSDYHLSPPASYLTVVHPSFQRQCIPLSNRVFSHAFHLFIRTTHQDNLLRRSILIVQHLVCPMTSFSHSLWSRFSTSFPLHRTRQK